METRWVIIPFVNNIGMTLQAVEDCLAQTVPTRVLLIDQGSDTPTREAIDAYIDGRGDQQVLCWHYLPALPALAAVWNRALQFVWELGGQEALVVNNDVRLHPRTLEGLLGALNVERYTTTGLLDGVPATERNLFVSAVGVREPQFDYAADHPLYWYDYTKRQVVEKGGPDFSCFLISAYAHAKYHFDDSFQPAYCEDLDTHRRYMLGGDGGRIFSVNLPFLHYASGTLKSYTPEQKQTFDKQYAGVVRRYTALWGGPPNQERYTVKGDPTSARDGVTTPELQRRVQAGEAVLGG